MELKSLQYFIAVYQTGSLSAAARRCHISQPSISAAIKQLEDTLGSQLFQRTAKGVLPTQGAEKLYPSALSLTAEAKSVREAFRDRPNTQPFILGLSRSLGTARMSRLLKQLIEALPDIELTLVNPDEFCHARVISLSMRQRNETFVPLWLDHYQLALPPQSALAHQSSIRQEQMRDMPMILRSPCEAFHSLETQLRREGVELSVRAQIRTVEYAIGLVGAGVGASFLPQWSQQLEKTTLMRPIDDIHISVEIGLAYSSKHLNLPLSTLLDLSELTQDNQSSDV